MPIPAGVSCKQIPTTLLQLRDAKNAEVMRTEGTLKCDNDATCGRFKLIAYHRENTHAGGRGRGGFEIYSFAGPIAIHKFTLLSRVRAGHFLGALAFRRDCFRVRPSDGVHLF